jgi:hypothetical protein
VVPARGEVARAFEVVADQVAHLPVIEQALVSSESVADGS